MDEESNSLKLPEIEGGDHMVNHLTEAGICLSNGMGLMPLTWQEIDSWLSVTGLELTTWEKLTLKELSEAYVNEYSLSSDKTRPAPYVHKVDEIDRQAVSDKLKGIFRGLKKRPTQHDE